MVLDVLIGRTVEKIFWNDERLLFLTDQGPLGFYTWGDCCSHSYFHDFYGVKHLLNNGPVLEVKAISLVAGDTWDEDYMTNTLSYGYAITTLHKQYGEVTSVFSFRNDSNGYYGGGIQQYPIDFDFVPKDLEELTEDCVGR